MGACPRADVDGFEAYVRASEARHKRLAFLLTGDLHQAEDLLQAAYAKTYPHWNKVRNYDVPDAYLRRVMITSSWRRSRNRDGLFSRDRDEQREQGARPPAHRAGPSRGRDVMSTRNHDSIFDSLDQVARLADAGTGRDRLPDIHRRVRVARRRKSVGAVTAALVLAVGGGGTVAEAARRDSAADSGRGPRGHVPPGDHHRSQAGGTHHGEDQLHRGGESTAYVDTDTGAASGAGPISTEVRVDGEVVDRAGPGALSCEPGGAVESYPRTFHAARPLVATVATAGEHTVTVSAPYCADGDVVESTQESVVTTEVATMVVLDKLTTDLDGDDRVRLLAPADGQGDEHRLELRSGTGETSTTMLPNAYENSQGVWRAAGEGPGSREAVPRSTSASTPVTAKSATASTTTPGQAATVQACPARLPKTEEPR